MERDEEGERWRGGERDMEKERETERGGRGESECCVYLHLRHGEFPQLFQHIFGRGLAQHGIDQMIHISAHRT